MPSPSWFATPSWSHSTRSMLRRPRPHRPARAHGKPAHAAALNASPTQAGDAAVAPAPDGFGSLVDLARLQIGTPSVEICDACNTINIGSARHCKCCAHKLPGFYAALEGPQVSRSWRFSWDSLGLSERASVMDFAAFSVVINVLMVITASIPIR